MRKTVIRLIATSLVVAANIGLMPLQAQNSSLVGMWQADNGQALSSNMGKIYLPNGKLYGYSLVPNHTDSLSTWIMGRYEVTAPGHFFEDIDFHTSINYQCLLSMNYRIENDGNLLITEYVNILPNGQSQIVSERWLRKELTEDRIAFLTGNWNTLLTQACKTYGRLPAEGQSINAAADSLKNLSDNYKQSRNLDATIYYLMVRAELDSTNLNWQNDVLSFVHEQNSAPAFANKYVDRIVRLSEAQAVSPTDTLVVNAYCNRAIICMRQKDLTKAFKAINHAIDLSEQSGHQKENAELWHLKSLIHLQAGNFNEMRECAIHAVSLMKENSKYSRSQLAELYYIAAMALFLQERWAEALEYAEVSLPLYDSMPIKQNEVRSAIYKMYENLLQNQPNDKQMTKKYQSFMADKMICAHYLSAKENPWGLEGDYFVLEEGDWNIDSPLPYGILSGKSNSMLLFKDGSIRRITKETDKGWQANLNVVLVSKSWKDTIRKEWKNYKKESKK